MQSSQLPASKPQESRVADNLLPPVAANRTKEVMCDYCNACLALLSFDKYVNRIRFNLCADTLFPVLADCNQARFDVTPRFVGEVG